MCFHVIGILLWFQKSDVVETPIYKVLILLLGVPLCGTFLVTVVEVTRPNPEIRIQGFSGTSPSFSCQLELRTAPWALWAMTRWSLLLASESAAVIT